MKFFIAHAYTGVDQEILSFQLKSLNAFFEINGHTSYCGYFDPYKQSLQNKADVREIFEYAFKNILQCDALAALITSNKKSEGLLLEVGCALSQHKPLYLFVHNSQKKLPSHLKTLATKIIYFDSFEKIEQLKIKL